MTGPKIYLSSTSKDSAKEGVSVRNRSPYWVVCFVRFKEACAMYSGSKDEAFLTKTPLIVENDCIAVSINNSKNSYAKTCSLSMKPGDVWFPNAVSTGDWVFVWMTEDRQSSERILNWLMKAGGTTPNFAKTTDVNGWNSGLKFVGRVLNLSNSTSISPTGSVSISQTVNCQSFLEMANSVYYTYIAKSIIPDEKTTGSAIAKANLRSLKEDNTYEYNGMEKALTKIADLFLGYAKDTSGFSTPDEIIAIMFILIMGVEKEKSMVNVIDGLAGSFGDAIGVPSLVANILGRGGKKKLWQMYNVILGLQKYTDKKNIAESLFPDLDIASSTQDASSVFYKTTMPTKGVVPLQIPPIWDNRSLWNVLNGFLNSVVNEMYTCLRINKHGEIVPTLIVREMPFSTGMYDFLNGKASQFKIDKTSEIQSNLKKQIDEEEGKAKSLEDERLKKEWEFRGESNKKRTMYNNLPRWIIPEEKVISFNISTDESKRINFVQVWGRSNSAEYLNIDLDQEKFKQAQYRHKNFIADETDIARHGLRADITETIFDIPVNEGGGYSNMFARMRADWLLNGHLKPSGTITMMGIQEPICEGDNIEFQGIVFHIVGVSHQGSISSNGLKSFTTTLQIENGMVASALESPEMNKALYPKSFGESRDSVNRIFNLKGKTDIQNTGERKGRTEGGEPKKSGSIPKKGK